jgi:hypothetical protein
MPQVGGQTQLRELQMVTGSLPVARVHVSFRIVWIQELAAGNFDIG